MFASIQSTTTTSNMGPNSEDERMDDNLTLAWGHIINLIDQVSNIKEELLLLQSTLEEILPQDMLTGERQLNIPS